MPCERVPDVDRDRLPAAIATALDRGDVVIAIEAVEHAVDAQQHFGRFAIVQPVFRVQTIGERDLSVGGLGAGRDRLAEAARHAVGDVRPIDAANGNAQFAIIAVEAAGLVGGIVGVAKRTIGIGEAAIVRIEVLIHQFCGCGDRTLLAAGDDVVAIAALDVVGTGAAINRVVAGATFYGVIAQLSENLVVTVTAIEKIAIGVVVRAGRCAVDRHISETDFGRLLRSRSSDSGSRRA